MIVKVRLDDHRALGSFDIVPVHNVRNGALMVPDFGTPRRADQPPSYWIRQSPRELSEMRRINLGVVE